MVDRNARPLLPAYLLLGTDGPKRAEALRRMDARLEAQGADLDFNKETIDASPDVTAAGLRASLDTLPFASDVRLVVVTDVDRLSKDASEQIVSYLKSPSPSTVLVMTSAKLARNTRLFKAIDHVGPGAVVECAPREKKELPQFVIELARARGFSMDYEAASELVARVGESSALLEGEVTKLAVARAGARSISVDDVRSMVARITEVKPWDILDAMCERKPALAMRLLENLPAKGGLGFMSLAVTRVRELICAKALSARGRAADLADELGLPPKMAWKVKNYGRWASNFSMAELRGALISACQAEADLKSSADNDLVLRRWILKMCSTNAR